MFKWLGSVLAFLFMAAAIPAQAQFGEPDLAEIEKEDFFREGLAPVRKDAGYNLTIVYFMDYQCPACRKYTPDVAKALGEDRKLRIIYRDTPIFGPRSEAAARAAIASQFQGRHEAFHHALMTTKLPLDEPALQAAARKAGVDWQRLQSDIEKRRAEIDRQIATNTALSSATGISGTPAFIIGNRLADGAMDYKGLKAEIADARKELGIAAIAVKLEEPAAEPESLDAKPKETGAQDATAEAPVFERAGPAPAIREPAPRVSVPSIAWPAWFAGIGVVLAALLGWLAWRRRSKSMRP